MIQEKIEINFLKHGGSWKVKLIIRRCIKVGFSVSNDGWCENLHIINKT